MEIDSPKRKPLAKPKQSSAGSQPQVAKVKVPKTKKANQKKATEVWVEIEARWDVPLCYVIIAFLAYISLVKVMRSRTLAFTKNDTTSLHTTMLSRFQTVIS